MTSRVEELQRMCDAINENGGLDSGEWHTALLAQIAQNLAVIADVMMADRKTEPQTEVDWKQRLCDMYGTDRKSFDEAWKKYEADKIEDEPQTDCAWK